MTLGGLPGEADFLGFNDSPAEGQTSQKRPDRQRDNPKKRTDRKNEMKGAVGGGVPERLIVYSHSRYLPHVRIDEDCQSREDRSYEQETEAHDHSEDSEPAGQPASKARIDEDQPGPEDALRKHVRHVVDELANSEQQKERDKRDGADAPGNCAAAGVKMIFSRQFLQPEGERNQEQKL
jgi:hypothetical protein